VEETNKKRVLIVDDEPVVRLLVRQMLGKDYTVLEAQDGQEAVSIARSQKPDVILMDMLMPKMDGLTACYVIKTGRTTKATPVVMLTAIGHELNKKLSQDVMGADGYITKPFTREALLQAISQL
jgi:two-component system alkaline phosphatase synthesis response regulator PhoP